MSHFRLGVVPYVNAMPLWVPLEKQLVSTQHSFTFEKAVPDRLARDLAAGQVDCATLSIVEAMRNVRLRVVDGVCIASRGAVETVQIFHQRPLAECRKVLLDKDSRTSSFVTKLLLNTIFPLAGREFASGMVDPHLLPPVPEAAAAPVLPPLVRAEAVDLGHLPPGQLEHSHGPPQVAAAVAPVGPAGHNRSLLQPIPLSDYDAFLSIGDKTWEFMKSSWDRTDVGELWTNHTQLPMVWAAWTCGESCAVKDLAPVLVRARETGGTILDDIIQRLSRSREVDKAQVWRYLTEVMHYKLGHEEKQAISKLFEMGAAVGSLPSAGRVYFVS